MTMVLTERPAEGVALLRLNRPERRNALGIELRRQLADAITAFTADESIKCIVVTGDEKAFAAGADLSEIADAAPGDAIFTQLGTTRRALAECRIPVIAAVRGLALGGGCELAMMCDIVVAGEGARFGQPEVRFGIMPGAGGTQRLLQAAGKAKALRWLLTGDLFDAATAETLGIVSEIVPDAEVVSHSIALAEAIAKLPGRAVVAIKDAVRLGENAPIDTALAFEHRLFQLLFSTEDQKEGMRAFLEKRAPVFKHR